MNSHVPGVDLSSAQRALYHEQGFLVLPPLTDATELTSLREICDRLIATGAGRKDGNQHDLTGTERQSDVTKESVPQLLHPSRYAPELKSTRVWAHALEVAMQLLAVGTWKRDELVVRDHIIVKPPGSTKPTPWHQDEAYWKDDLAYNELSIWIALQDVTEDMGCMTFIPRSNKRDVIPHHPWQNDPRIIALEADEGHFDPNAAVACPLPAGAATVHHCRTLHYTSGNRSSVWSRRALILTIGTPPQPLATPRNHYWNRERRSF